MTLLVILGPTGVGKTELSIKLAKFFRCDIISADSRQMFRDMDIGTAKPTKEELAQVHHHFINNLDIHDYYSAAQYESEVISMVNGQQSTVNGQRSTVNGDSQINLMVGGSMMYIDAVCKGIDDIPTIDSDTRAMMKERLEKDGLERLCEELRMLDPEYYAIVDHKNTQRIVHALEICYMTGKTYTSFRKNSAKERPFRIVKVGLRRERENLFDRINRRVDQMVADGLLEETRRLVEQVGGLNSADMPNSLNTVGYKEMMNVLSGEWDMDFAVARMKKNTRVYAKKQMTWFQKDQDIHWFDIDKLSVEEIISEIQKLVNS